VKLCIAPPGGPTLRRGHNTAERYYQNLMYVGLRTSDTLHKTACWTGPGLCIMLEVNFRERCLCELRRIPIPRTRVNKGKIKGRGC